MKRRRTKREELEKERDLPKIVDTPKGRMLVPNPLDLDALIRRIPTGMIATVGQIREKLAKDFQVDITCPMTSGIFIRLVAEAAEEDLEEGRKGEDEVTPYWRVIQTDGRLNPKFPRGVDSQSKRLRKEGHTIEPGKGKKPPRVRDFERHLQEF